MKKFILTFAILLFARLAFADFLVHEGSLTTTAGTGTQAITGVGFQPKIVFFQAAGVTSTGAGSTANINYGACVSSSAEGNIGFSIQSGGNNWNTSIDSASCIAAHGSTTTSYSFKATLSSMDSDGFTINKTTAFTGLIYTYLALGGSDITGVNVGEIATASSNGSVSTTGVGFKPDILFLYASNPTADGIAHNATTLFMRAVGIDSTHRFVTSSNWLSNTTASAYQNTSQIVNINTNVVGDLSSMDSDGFTITYSVTDAAAHKMIYVAIKGPKVKIGTFNQNVTPTTGNQAITGVGFQPSALILDSFGAASNAGNAGVFRPAVGFAASSSARHTIANPATPATTQTSSHYLDTANVLRMGHDASGTFTTDTLADFVSFDSDGFTINNTTVDATARQVMYVALGSVGGAPPPVPHNVQLMWNESILPDLTNAPSREELWRNAKDGANGTYSILATLPVSPPPLGTTLLSFTYTDSMDESLANQYCYRTRGCNSAGCSVLGSFACDGWPQLPGVVQITNVQ